MGTTGIMDQEEEEMDRMVIVSTPDDEPPSGKRPGRPGSLPVHGDNFGDGLWGQSCKPVTGRSRLPKLDLPPRVHVQRGK